MARATERPEQLDELFGKSDEELDLILDLEGRIRPERPVKTSEPTREDAPRPAPRRPDERWD